MSWSSFYQVCYICMCVHVLLKTQFIKIYQTFFSAIVCYKDDDALLNNNKKVFDNITFNAT